LQLFPLEDLAKFSYSLFNNVTNDLIMDRLIIVSQNQNIQDYTNKTNNNFFMPKVVEVLKCQIQDRRNQTVGT
jgi:hypothetical protein